MVVVTVGDRSDPQLTKLNLGSVAYRDADGKEKRTTGMLYPAEVARTGSAPSTN
jgi:hypothetical protein